MSLSSYYKRHKDVISEIIFSIAMPALAVAGVFYYLNKTSSNNYPPSTKPIKEIRISQPSTLEGMER